MIFEKPRRFSYSQVLAEFYYRARRQGWTIYLDYKLKNQWGKKFKASAAIVVENEVICLVWVRNSYNSARYTNPKRKRLEALGVPVVIVRQMERVPVAIEEVKAFVVAAKAKLGEQPEELPI